MEIEEIHGRPLCAIAADSVERRIVRRRSLVARSQPPAMDPSKPPALLERGDSADRKREARVRSNAGTVAARRLPALIDGLPAHLRSQPVMAAHWLAARPAERALVPFADEGPGE